jgi:hypothetical protein
LDLRNPFPEQPFLAQLSRSAYVRNLAQRSRCAVIVDRKMSAPQPKFPAHGDIGCGQMVAATILGLPLFCGTVNA